MSTLNKLAMPRLKSCLLLANKKLSAMNGQPELLYRVNLDMNRQACSQVCSRHSWP